MDINELHSGGLAALPQTARDKIQQLLTGAADQKKRTWTYYEKLRKEDEKKYWKAETQKQLHQDAIDLGDAFLDD